MKALIPRSTRPVASLRWRASMVVGKVRVLPVLIVDFGRRFTASFAGFLLLVRSFMPASGKRIFLLLIVVILATVRRIESEPC